MGDPIFEGPEYNALLDRQDGLRWKGVSPDPLGHFEMIQNPCVELEVNAMECVEYYGIKRGSVICKDYYDDFLECKFGFKQVTM